MFTFKACPKKDKEVFLRDSKYKGSRDKFRGDIPRRPIWVNWPRVDSGLGVGRNTDRSFKEKFGKMLKYPKGELYTHTNSLDY